MTQNVISNGRCVAQGTSLLGTNTKVLGAGWETRLFCGYNDANPTQQACGGDSGENWEQLFPLFFWPEIGNLKTFPKWYDSSGRVVTAYKGCFDPPPTFLMG